MLWEELTGDNFSAAVKQVEGVCLVPTSCLERHAHHLPLATDMFIAREICLRAAALEPTIIFPNYIFTQIMEARHYPGAVALDAELLIRLLENVCREIARNGLTKIILANAHGGNYHFLRFFAQSQLISSRDYAVYIIDPSLLPADKDAIREQWETRVDGHAGESETSQILAIRPDLAIMETLPENNEGMPLERLNPLKKAGVFTSIGWYADHPTHYCGDGRPATAEKGDHELNANARALAAAIRIIKQDKITGKLQDEFFGKSR